jgi:uncharacterized protein YqgC (DUF456 family)
MPTTLISGILILVGLVGIAVPVLPGLVLVWLSVLLWAVGTHSPTGWTILAVATALTVLGLVARYLVPGRRLRAAGVPALTTVSGVVLAVVGFFVIPVVGAFVGFVLGVYLAECVRLRSHRHAWPTTMQALRAIGLSFGIELGTGLLVAGTWVTGVLLTR